MIRTLLAATLVVGMAALSAPAAPNKQPPDPPGTTPIMNQLRAWFEQADANSDGILDKEELAKAFRGPKAKPFDYVAPKKGDPKADDPPKDNPPTDPKPTDSGSTPVDNKLTTTSADAKKYGRFIDYQFLQTVDTNKDQQISKEEFGNWARGYAKQVKQYQDQERKMAQLQQRLNNQMATQARRQLQNEMQAMQRQMQQMQKAMNQQLHHHFHH